LKAKTGIVNFFGNETKYSTLKQQVKVSQSVVCESQAEYGNYQTNKQLAQSVCNHLKNKNITPSVLIEPTCGKGSLIFTLQNRV